ncbi:5-formyltetrahydrofolate cyclo-ligase [bacterium]|nr:5-formyltetrahydrofolate cyclo-ligase [bacterium]
MDKKTDLRVKAKNIRRSIDITDVSKKLVGLIRKHQSYFRAKNVLLYYPKVYEVDLRDLLKDNKNFYLPRVEGDILAVCPYKLGDKLVVSRFNLLEPISAPVDPRKIDLIITPALMVNKEGYRLGYGNGYYDRLLTSLEDSDVKTLCAMPVELVNENLPHNFYDVPVNYVVYI